MRLAHLRTAARRHSPVLVVVPVVALAVHLGLAGYALAHWRWSLPALAAIAALIAVKVLLFTGFRALRRRR